MMMMTTINSDGIHPLFIIYLLVIGIIIDIVVGIIDIITVKPLKQYC